MRILERLISRPLHPPDEVQRYPIQRILVVRQHDQLGDFLISTPVLRALRGQYPNAHICLITRSYTNDVARHNRYIDDHLVLYDSGYQYSWGWFQNFWRTLRAGYDLAIVLNTVSHSLSSDILAWLSRARFILGPEFPLLTGASRNFFYNVIASYDPQPKHQSHRNLDIVRYIGIDTDDPSEHMTITEEEQAWAREWIALRAGAKNTVLLGMHPGAGKLENRWPVERFAAVANYFYEKYGIRWVVSWGPSEAELGALLCRQLSFEPVVLTDVSLRQFAAVISSLPFFLCNDTGVLHVAAAAGTPLLAIFGPTNVREWKPLGNDFQAIQGHDGTVQAVSEAMIIEKMETLLRERNVL